jgi:hypothetical protein
MGYAVTVKILDEVEDQNPATSKVTVQANEADFPTRECEALVCRAQTSNTVQVVGVRALGTEYYCDEHLGEYVWNLLTPFEIC